MRDDSDDTVVLRPQRRQPKRRWPWGIAALLLVCGSGAGGYFFVTRTPLLAIASAPPAAPTPAASSPGLSRPAAPAVIETAAAVPPPIAVPLPPVSPVTPVSADPAPSTPPPLPPLQTEAGILARYPEFREVYRFAPQPEIVVLQFATLSDQARMLNRVAALIEKAGFPRDRVLPDVELDQKIRAGGDDPDTFYLGHDYRATDLLRFFSEAEKQGVALTQEEMWLRQSLAAWNWRPGTNAALISLARENPAVGLDKAARATILRHELSHGAYFTRPAYAAYVHQFWKDVMTRPEHASFRTFLAGEGYDTTQDDLVINETQAYLIHTADPRFFAPDRVGLTAQRLEILRGLFVTGMPPGWLRDCTAAPAATPRP